MTDLSNEEINYLNDDDVVHTKGVVATLTNHKFYIDKTAEKNKLSQK